LFLNVDTGYSHAFAQAPERSAAPFNAYFGAGGGSDSGAVGTGLSVRTKWSDNVQQFAIAPFLYAALGAEQHDGTPPWAFFLVGGFDVVTAEVVAARNAVSIGSPFVELGAFFKVYRMWGITTGISFEDDIRFSDIPNTGYVSFLLGFGTVSYGDPLH